MASFKQDGIQFTSVLPGQRLPNKYGNDANGIFADAATDGVEPFINAVEIDWNGAQWPTSESDAPVTPTTINTTGDLLSWIKEGIEEAAVSGRTSEVVRRSLWIN